MILNLLVLPATLYLLMTAICITNRMTRRTKFRTRLTVISMGFIAMWSAERIVGCEWVPTPANITLAAVVILLAITMWRKFPRVHV